MLVPEIWTKKKIDVEAIQLTKDNFEAVEKFVGLENDLCRHYNHEGDYMKKKNPQGVMISTLEGTMLAKVGDWVIKGIKGEFILVHQIFLKKHTFRLNSCNCSYCG